MQPQEIRDRLTVLETKLDQSIDRLEDAINLANRNNEKIEALYHGDYRTPSLLARVIALEKFNATLTKTIWIMYTAVIGTLITLLIRNV